MEVPFQRKLFPEAGRAVCFEDFFSILATWVQKATRKIEDGEAKTRDATAGFSLGGSPAGARDIHADGRGLGQDGLQNPGTVPTPGE